MTCYVLQTEATHNPHWVRYPSCTDGLVPLTDDSRAAWRFGELEAVNFLRSLPYSTGKRFRIRHAFFSERGDIRFRGIEEEESRARSSATIVSKARPEG